MNLVPPLLSEAIEQWSKLLGGEHVSAQDALCDSYARIAAAQSGTRPAAILYPASTEQVQGIVQIAERFRVSLHPISRGKNWGYGSACAPTDGQVIVDLRRMNRIIEVNPQLAYAVIEPGVTQKQLFDYLQNHRVNLWMDCTGAGFDASIVGNALDRGFGHTPLGDHVLNTCGMEVVLADGRVLKTGLGHYANARADRVYRYGVGPFLDGVFSQSNLGIVTQIGLWLMPKPEYFCAFLVSAARPDDLSDLVDRLSPLRLKGFLRSAIHIANDVRAMSSRIRYPWHLTEGRTPMPDSVRASLRQQFGIGAWNGIGAIYGTRASVGSVKKLLRRALRPYRLRFIDDRKLSLAHTVHGLTARVGWGRRLGEHLAVISPVYGLLKGTPSDEPLAGTDWRVRDEGAPRPTNPLDTHAGLMWVSPVLPTQGASAGQLMDLIDPIYAEHGFDTLVTFTMVNERAMICVTNVAFDRRQAEEAERAQRCYDKLMDTLIDQGFIPYRVGINGFEKLIAPSTVYWDVARQIKQALDPHGVISPGRYIPTEHGGEGGN